MQRLMLLCTAALACSCSTTHQSVGDTVQSKAQFELLSSLAGEWVGTVGGADQRSPVETSIRVTGNKSTVCETMFKGTDHEMVSMYHLDGDRLMHTHYCSAGNQPRMVALAPRAHGQIVFAFLDATNLVSPETEHMHEMRLQVVDADHIEQWWTGWKDGRADHTAHFVLTRKK